MFAVRVTQEGFPLPDHVNSEQPFEGIRVVEFGQFVAVPFAAQLLAEGGARVIKVEPVDGDPARRLRPLASIRSRDKQSAENSAKTLARPVAPETRTFLSRNRGKRSLPLALRHPEAKSVIDALLGWADVVLMNFRPGVAEELGLGASALCGRFPRLIVGSVSAFGREGPEADRAGMDIVVQARSGLMAANGRIVDGRPATGDPVSADYMCAMTLAFGVSAALLRRERTGRGGRVDTSLLQSAMTLANNQLIRAESEDGPIHRNALDRLAELRAAGAPHTAQAEVIPSVRARAMSQVYFRTYETADATIAVACGSPSLRERFMRVIGLDDPGLSTNPGPHLDAHYDALKLKAEAKLRQRSSTEWVAELNDAGVPVSTVRFPIELIDDPQTAANGMFHTFRHPTVGEVTALSPPVNLDAAGFTPAPPTAALGSDTAAILTELGFAGDQIDALLDAQASRER